MARLLVLLCLALVVAGQSPAPTPSAKDRATDSRKILAGADIRATNSYRVGNGPAHWDKSSSTWLKNSVSGTSLNPSFASANKWLWFPANETLVTLSNDRQSFITHDNVYSYKLGQKKGGGDLGCYSPGPPKTLNNRCTSGGVTNYVQSQNTLFICGEITMVNGKKETTVRNSSCVGCPANTNTAVNNLNNEHLEWAIYSFEIGGSMDSNLNGDFSFLWPVNFTTQNPPLPQPGPKTFSTGVCNSMVATENGFVLVETGGSTATPNNILWHFDKGSKQWTQLATQFSFRANDAQIQVVKNNIFVYGRNFVSGNTQTGNYIQKATAAAGGAATFTPLTFPNASIESRINKWVVNDQDKVYMTFASNYGPSNNIRNNEYWALYLTHYIWEFSGTPSAVVETGTHANYWGLNAMKAIGDRNKRFTSSVSEVTSNTDAAVVTNFNWIWDWTLGGLVAWADNLNYVMTGNVERTNEDPTSGVRGTQWFFNTDERRVAFGWEYTAYPVNKIVFWTGSNWDPAYGGGLDMGSAGAQSLAVSDFGFSSFNPSQTHFRNRRWVYDTFTPYLAQFDPKYKGRGQIGVDSFKGGYAYPINRPNLRHGLWAYPKLGTAVSVRYAKWFKISGQDRLLVAGQFRTTSAGSTVNSIVWMKTDGTFETLPPNGGEASGVRAVYAETANRFHNPGEIVDVVERNNILYVIGNFDYAGGVKANSIAQYNIKNSTWAPVGNGFVTGKGVKNNLNVLRTLALDGNRLWVGGNFQLLAGGNGDQIRSKLPKDKKTKLTIFQTSINAYNRVYTRNVAYWDIDKQMWVAPHTGTDAAVDRLYRWNGEIYAFGSGMTKAGGRQVFQFARWSDKGAKAKRWIYVDPDNSTLVCTGQKYLEIDWCQVNNRITDVYSLHGVLYLMTASGTNGRPYVWNGDSFRELTRRFNFQVGTNQRSFSKNPNTNNLQIYNIDNYQTYSDSQNVLEYDPKRFDFPDFVPGPGGLNTGNLLFASESGTD